MKLYELKRGQLFKIIDNKIKIPPRHIDLKKDDVLKFGHIDGMYSLCYMGDQLVHPAAWTTVEALT